MDLISFSWVLKSCDTFIFCFLDCSLATFVEKLKGGIFSRKNECEMDWNCCLRGNDWFLASRPGPQDRALWLHGTLPVNWTGNTWTLKWNLSHGLMEPTLAVPSMGLLPWRRSLWAWENVARFHLGCQGCVCYCCSVAKSCLTSPDPRDCSTPGFPVLLSPRVCSNLYPLSQWYYLTISSSAAGFFFCLQSFPASGSFLMSQLSASKCWSFSFSISPSSEYSELTSFQFDWLEALALFLLLFLYKLPQTEWLKTTWIYHLTFLEVKRSKLGLMGLKSRCQQGCVPSGGTRGEPIPDALAFGGCPHSPARGHITLNSASVHTAPSVTLGLPFLL